ncbi:flavodoxin family protein [Pseudotamlana agarivorans]|uniref:flavodoxin family protein n=1 Tax=Pseudotamlana agarivorans TaxID=481183 RepID=UPI0008375C1E|nr:NAD(P)H-dependent oxidoreductase [Tamlana agarivorans]
MKTVIISGSSRNDGHTNALTNQLVKNTNWDLINLNDYNIGYFDYDHASQGDDYLNLIRELLDNYDTIVFATPVYWYAMSGIMKVFFDRLTDLITIEKELGRKLRGKNMAVISSSHGENLGEHFWLPFQSTATYLGMNYLGHAHTISTASNDFIIENFIKSVGK